MAWDLSDYGAKEDGTPVSCHLERKIISPTEISIVTRYTTGVAGTSFRVEFGS